MASHAVSATANKMERSEADLSAALVLADMFEKL